MDIKTTSNNESESFLCILNEINFGDLHPIREEVQDFMKYHINDKRHVDSALLTITEILTNIIKHGDEPPTNIEIRIDITESSLEIDIMDNGSPFREFRNIVDDVLQSSKNCVSSGQESGFGIDLVYNINDTIEYVNKDNSTDGCNHFFARKTIDNLFDEELKVTKKVFLIDDEPIALQIHSAMLDDEYDVMTFESGSEALKAFSKFKPDIVISDLVMPNIGGIDLRKKLTTIEDGNTTPFVFLSGNQYGENSIYINHLGIDDFLCKPITEEKLKNVVARLIKRSKQLRQSIQGKLNRDITDMLRPSMPEDKGNWSFHIKFQIADAGGGDFVLNKDTDDGLITILSDVMGHDVQAKFFAYTYAGYLRSLFKNNPNTGDGAKFLNYLSKAVGEDSLLESVIMTCQYFRVFNNGKVSISSAGHPKPLLIKSDDHTARIINTTGPIPGLTIDNLYNNVEEKLEVGDKLLFMTDGFIDVFEKTGMATEALIEVIQDSHEEYGEYFDEYLWKSFLARQETSNISKDDATIIIAKYNGE